MKKMTMRKMFEKLVTKTAEEGVFAVKLVDAASGEVYEADFAVDLLVDMVKTEGVNLLWEVEIVAAKIVAGKYVTVIFNPDIEQVNGDPDKGNTWL